MKKTLAIVLSAIFVMVLSACGAKVDMGDVGNAGGNSGIQSSAQNEAKITAEEALDIALKDATLKKGEVTMIESYLDYDNGILVYDIEFDHGSHEYSYEINAKTGVIVDRDKDIED